MKRFCLFAVLFTLLSFSSCVITDEFDDASVSYDVVITNGVPYYYNGITWYLYNGYYYRPHMFHGHRHMYRYNGRPFHHGDPRTRIEPRSGHRGFNHGRGNFNGGHRGGFNNNPNRGGMTRGNHGGFRGGQPHGGQPRGRR